MFRYAFQSVPLIKRHKNPIIIDRWDSRKRAMPYITNTNTNKFLRHLIKGTTIAAARGICNVNENWGDYNTGPPTFRSVHQLRQNNPLSTANLEIEAWTFQREIKPESNKSLLSNWFCINKYGSKNGKFSAFIISYRHSIISVQRFIKFFVLNISPMSYFIE